MTTPMGPRCPRWTPRTRKRKRSGAAQRCRSFTPRASPRTSDPHGRRIPGVPHLRYSHHRFRRLCGPPARAPTRGGRLGRARREQRGFARRGGQRVPSAQGWRGCAGGDDLRAGGVLTADGRAGGPRRVRVSDGADRGDARGGAACWTTTSTARRAALRRRRRARRGGPNTRCRRARGSRGASTPSTSSSPRRMRRGATHGGTPPKRARTGEREYTTMRLVKRRSEELDTEVTDADTGSRRWRARPTRARLARASSPRTRRRTPASASRTPPSPRSADARATSKKKAVRSSPWTHQLIRYISLLPFPSTLSPLLLYSYYLYSSAAYSRMPAFFFSFCFVTSADTEIRYSQTRRCM
ncbi:hypothetical protein FB451DRAFT_694605 [Mycena latifolia]|nr:hypothetical protein FB451DRAFT_694605 [Mycena latifolia]